MMDTNPLPPELAELESRLRSRIGYEPSAGFRARVVGAAERVHASRPMVIQWGPMQWSAAAAAILIVLNLSMISASQTAFSLDPPRERVSLASYLQILQQADVQQNRVTK